MKTTDSRHSEPVAENILGQDFSATEVGAKIGCDITYVETGEGWLYLAVVLDVCSRKVLGYIDEWYNSERLHSSLGMASPMEFIRQQRLAA